MKRIVVLISGRGSNLTALIKAAQTPHYPGAIVAVISNRADAAGLQTAADVGIATAVLKHQDFPDRLAFDTALIQRIDSFVPDLVVLAGFMRLLSSDFVNHYNARLINIHPSLLPAFTGLHTHERALQAGVKLHGCTVHFVTPELDVGPIIAQAAVPVRDDDTADTLAARVLAEEHKLYPEAVRWICEERVRIDGLRVSVQNTIQ